ncbi:hypothetical protein C7447_103186 [Tenacibaculum adriaticum]|uniref:DUF5723 domain-containing protein n=1 Tax=Tenacibaculum adriaticum TaxID=413713 RepID=A0A5S5DRK5_9FLAO|nr:DUF5723 family protein [Tenacibaculum adriaticum]TYP98018.1 hypothetical protein C7447_103186 [Tenacibaculum adriaticum]
MRKILLALSLLYLMTTQAQNKQILYGFDKIPQGLLLNPGAETTYKYHVGIPFLSGLSFNGNMSGITVADVFRDDGIGIFSGTDFNTKFRNAIDKLGDKDYAYINTQIEVLSGGYKLNDRDYLSVGFYTEADVFMSLPKDIFTLINEGNAAYLNKTFSISDISAKGDVLGVLHAGISRRFNNEFTAGARFKIYSGSMNVTSTGNSGTFTTREGQDNIYVHHLNNIDAGVYSSGIYDEENEVDISAGSIFGSTFLGGNFGLGFDVGLTYHYNEQIELTASLLDIGFVSYSKNTRNGTVNGSYTFSGVEFQYDDQNTNYWADLEDDFDANVIREENRESYTVMRPIKFNSSFRYSFGKSRNELNCHDITFKDFYDNAVGAQLYSVFHPNGTAFALTGFYERKFSNYLNTKFTYTIDDFSYTNFGVGVSANIWKLNIYGMVDNIFQLSDIADANRATFQLGINLIYN